MSFLETFYTQILYELVRVFVRGNRILPSNLSSIYFPIFLLWGMILTMFVIKLMFRLMGRNVH